jgi:hypothetical protein
MMMGKAQLSEGHSQHRGLALSLGFGPLCGDLGFYLPVMYIHELASYVHCAKLGNLHPSWSIDSLPDDIDCHNTHYLVPPDLNEIGMVLAKD